MTGFPFILAREARRAPFSSSLNFFLIFFSPRHITSDDTATARPLRFPSIIIQFETRAKRGNYATTTTGFSPSPPSFCPFGNGQTTHSGGPVAAIHFHSQKQEKRHEEIHIFDHPFLAYLLQRSLSCFECECQSLISPFVPFLLGRAVVALRCSATNSRKPHSVCPSAPRKTTRAHTHTPHAGTIRTGSVALPVVMALLAWVC